MQTAADTATLLFTGDVMVGRGIDQVLVHPNAPELYEFSVRDARDYVRLAECVAGPIPARVSGRYLWGEALEEIDLVAPDAAACPKGGRPPRMDPESPRCMIWALLAFGKWPIRWTNTAARVTSWRCPSTGARRGARAIASGVMGGAQALAPGPACRHRIGG